MFGKRIIAQIGLTVTLLAEPARAGAASLPPGFVEETVVQNINAATALTMAPDGRVFYAEQTGALRIWKSGRLLETPALDLSDRLDTWWERGFIGLSLHPDFPRTPFLFVVYVAKHPHTHHVVSRFTVSGDRVDPKSERILLRGDDQATLGGNVPAGHQGGPIRLGPDGRLYIGLGEQTAGKPSQSLNTLQGKILRINPDGTLPKDNPFYDSTQGKYRSIWAVGIRNPFGLAFEPGTGRLFETEVGSSAFEEVNIITKGGNYGWPKAEGPSAHPEFISPVHAYPPAVGRSICGGAFYPQQGSEPPDGSLFPADWRGKFFFVDWADHWIKALDPRAPTNVITFARGFNAPVGIEAAPDGSLFLLNRGTIWRDGKKFQSNSGSLVQIRYVGRDAAVAAASNPSPEPPPTLSQTDLFSRMDPLTPTPDFVPVEINLPPWRPGLRARRWLALPEGETIHFTPNQEWELPRNATYIEHLENDPPSSAGPASPFETHVFWFAGPRTAMTAAYRWNKNRSEARLVEDGEVVPIPKSGSPVRRWYSPGYEYALNLDTLVSGFHFPLRTSQLNRPVEHPRSGEPVNQILLWKERGWLDLPEQAGAPSDWPRLASLEDDRASLEHKVRSYLDVHCASCHRPGGLSRGLFDARLGTALEDQQIINGALATGTLDIEGAHVIVPGQPGKSIMLQRLRRTDTFRMPPVAVNNEPSPVVPVLEAWIRSMQATARRTD